MAAILNTLALEHLTEGRNRAIFMTWPRPMPDVKARFET
jgi:hypothetical protein